MRPHNVYFTIRGLGVQARLYSSELRRSWPLTLRGCFDAGQYLRKRGVERWLHSSSLDHPREYKRWFTYDVHDAMGRGWRAAEAARLEKENGRKSKKLCSACGR